MSRNIIKLKLLCITFMGIGIVGCGGGGGGGGSADYSTNYTGKTTPTTITADNAKAVSVDAIEGAQSTSAIGLEKSLAEAQNTAPKIQIIAELIEKSIIKAQPKSTIAKTVASTAQGTENGYSGSFTFSGQLNESTGAITGSITFDQYREYSDSITLSGNISFSGVFNQANDTFTNLNITVTNLSGTDGTDSIKLNGYMSINDTGVTKSFSISLVMSNTITNKTHWLKEFTFTLTGNMLVIGGRYYDHVNGYVDISTVIPITVSDSDDYTSGQLLFTGSNGTKARLTYTPTGYLLEVDASGNNTYVVVP